MVISGVWGVVCMALAPLTLVARLDPTLLPEA